MGILRDDLCFMVIYHAILLRMRTVSDKGCSENQNTRFMCITFFKKIMLFLR